MKPQGALHFARILQPPTLPTTQNLETVAEVQPRLEVHRLDWVELRSSGDALEKLAEALHRTQMKGKETRVEVPEIISCEQH